MTTTRQVEGIKKMQRDLRFFLLFVLLLGMVFDIIPDAGADAPKYDFFLLRDKKVSVVVLVYHLMEHIAWVAVAYVLVVEIVKYRVFLFYFMLVKIFDIVDYFLTYNKEWAQIGFLPISYNTVSFAFMVLVYASEEDWFKGFMQWIRR